MQDFPLFSLDDTPEYEEGDISGFFSDDEYNEIFDSVRDDDNEEDSQFEF